MITVLKKPLGIIISDILIFIALYILPGISHFLPVPHYLLEPMWFAAITAYFLNRNLPNAIIISLTIPLFSTLTTGHPVIIKSLLISFELLTNVILLHLFIKTSKLELFSELNKNIKEKTVFCNNKELIFKINV